MKASHRPASRLSRRIQSTVLLLGLLAPSCKSHHDSFHLTRTVYGSGGAAHGTSGSSVHLDLGCGDEAMVVGAVFLVLLALPVAIDLVLLPVTLTNDLCS